MLIKLRCEFITMSQSLCIAVAGLDYVPVTQELVFNNYTQSLYRLYIPIINDDDCVEEDEYFSVRITTDMDCVYLAPYDAHITIIDDDSKYNTCTCILLYFVLITSIYLSVMLYCMLLSF